MRAYPPSGHEHRILDHGALAVEQHGFPFGIGQAQIAFFPDAGVDHGLKRIEGGAEMLPEAAPAPVVVGQPLGIGRSAETVSVKGHVMIMSVRSSCSKCRLYSTMPLSLVKLPTCIDMRKHFLDDPLKGIDGKGVFNEHGYRGSAFGEGDWVSTSQRAPRCPAVHRPRTVRAGTGRK